MYIFVFQEKPAVIKDPRFGSIMRQKEVDLKLVPKFKVSTKGSHETYFFVFEYLLFIQLEELRI